MDVDLVPDAAVERRDHERVAVVNEPEMADEPGVEDRVDLLALVRAPLRLTPDTRPLGRRPPSHTLSLR